MIWRRCGRKRPDKIQPLSWNLPRETGRSRKYVRISCVPAKIQTERLQITITGHIIVTQTRSGNVTTENNVSQSFKNTINSRLTEADYSSCGVPEGFIRKIDWCVQCQKMNLMWNLFFKKEKNSKWREFYFAFKYVFENLRFLYLILFLMCRKDTGVSLKLRSSFCQ
jgi:hypothetical protein